MNLFLPALYVEHVERLALGIEPVDALRGTRVARPLQVTMDGAPLDAKRGAEDLFGLTEAGDGLGPLERRDSCRHVIRQRAGLKSPLKLRFNDPRRHYVPRRLSYPVPALPTDRTGRVRRPALFPGAAYDVDEMATGLRGRVTWRQVNEVPVRWTRVEARVGGLRVGYAHGDDRGEFLLILDSLAGGAGDFPVPLTAQVTVFAPPTPPARTKDVFSDLPLEELATVAGPDDVSPGTKLPSIEITGVMTPYASTASSTRSVTFEPGRLRTDEPKFFLAP